jgi:hypothetical protein
VPELVGHPGNLGSEAMLVMLLAGQSVESIFAKVVAITPRRCKLESGLAQFARSSKQTQPLRARCVERQNNNE